MQNTKFAVNGAGMASQPRGDATRKLMVDKILGAKKAADAAQLNTMLRLGTAQLKEATGEARLKKEELLLRSEHDDRKSRASAAIAGGAVASATAVILGVATGIDPTINLLTSFVVVPALTFVLHLYFERTEHNARGPGSVGARPRE